MLQYRLYGGQSLPNNLSGLLKAAANIGSVIGQFGFGRYTDVVVFRNTYESYLGYLADAFGRKAICEHSFRSPRIMRS